MLLFCLGFDYIDDFFVFCVILLNYFLVRLFKWILKIKGLGRRRNFSDLKEVYV